MTPSIMYQELRQSPQVVAQILNSHHDLYAEVSRKFHEHKPEFIATVARGSSDYAAYFGLYAFATQLGLMTVSLPPSLVTTYKAPLSYKSCLLLGISQSGQSPDLHLPFMQAAQDPSCLKIGIINALPSPLAELVDYTLPQEAGPELAVAATKSFIASLVVICRLIAEIKNDQELRNSLLALPDKLHQVLQQSWDISPFLDAKDVYVLSRGLGYPIALEAALKFKEVCQIHAEAFSTAEVMHGPKAILTKDLRILAFEFNDATKHLVDKQCSLLQSYPSTLIKACSDNATYPILDAGHDLLTPICGALAYYKFIEKLAIAKGLNPDTPPHLTKVTATL